MNHAGATTSLDHQVGPRGRFVLRQASGEITVRGVEGDHVRVRSLDGRSLGDQFEIEVGDGFVELRQFERFGLGKRFGGRVDSPVIEADVPHGATVSIDSASAELVASDLSGDKRFRTASGDMQLLRFAGAVDVQTVSGDVTLEGQAIVDLALKSVSGDVRVRVPRVRRFDLSTTSGDVLLDAELAGNGPFAIRSISGDARIVARAGLRIEAETITGDISSELPNKRESSPGRKVVIVGKAGPTLAFRSVSGDLQVVAPRDAAAVSAAPTPPMEPADIDASRLEILRALERGDITVAEATDRLGALEGVLR